MIGEEENWSWVEGEVGNSEAGVERRRWDKPSGSAGIDRWSWAGERTILLAWARWSNWAESRNIDQCIVSKVLRMVVRGQEEIASNPLFAIAHTCSSKITFLVAGR